MRSLTFEECGMVAGGALGEPMYTVYLGDSDDHGSQTGGQQNGLVQGSGSGGGTSYYRQTPECQELKSDMNKALRDFGLVAGATVAGGGTGWGAWLGATASAVAFQDYVDAARAYIDQCYTGYTVTVPVRR